MSEATRHTHVVSQTMEMTWHPESRIATIRFRPDILLGKEEGIFMIESLTGWTGGENKPFALLADTKGVRGTDAEYRGNTRDFFKLHRHHVYVAVTNMGPMIRMIAEMFRIATGIQLKGFADEVAARAWLREKGIAA